MSTDKTICLNSKVNGKQPSLADRIYDVYGIATACTVAYHPSIAEPISVAMRGRNPDNPSERGKGNGNYKQRIELNMSGVANALTSVQKDSMVAEPTYRIRKLTPRECFRLMGVEDEKIDIIQAAGISNSQQYKLAGNSIVEDVLYHLFRKMFCETGNESMQPTLF
jgi:site-specific DNA-cytosine methylase